MLLACFEQSLHEFESVSVACLPFCLSPSVQPPHTEFHNFDTVSQLICFTKTGKFHDNSQFQGVVSNGQSQFNLLQDILNKGWEFLKDTMWRSICPQSSAEIQRFHWWCNENHSFHLVSCLNLKLSYSPTELLALHIPLPFQADSLLFLFFKFTFQGAYLHPQNRWKQALCALVFCIGKDFMWTLLVKTAHVSNTLTLAQANLTLRFYLRDTAWNSPHISWCRGATQKKREWFVLSPPVAVVKYWSLQPGGPYNLTEGCLAFLPSTLTRKMTTMQIKDQNQQAWIHVGQFLHYLVSSMQELGSTW